MVRKKKPAARKPRKRKTGKRFRFQLSLPGVAGIAVVAFCLFLWMFLLGIWAGQTILLPSASDSQAKASRGKQPAGSPVKILKPDGKKNPVGSKTSLLRQPIEESSLSLVVFVQENRQGA